MIKKKDETIRDYMREITKIRKLIKEKDERIKEYEENIKEIESLTKKILKRTDNDDVFGIYERKQLKRKENKRFIFWTTSIFLFCTFIIILCAMLF